MKTYRLLTTLIALVFCTLAHAKEAAPNGKLLTPIQPARFHGPVRVACVGDSITAGMGASRGHSYPDELQRALGENWLVKNFGVSGRTLLRKGDRPYWNERAFSDAKDFAPDAVLIMLGTNDSKPENWAHKDEFKSDYRDLINTFRTLPSKPRVYLCRPIPVVGDGNFNINEPTMEKITSIIRELATEMKLDLIDLHSPLEGKPEWLPDRVHPNNQGTAAMAKTAAIALSGSDTPAPPLMRLNSLFHDHAVLQRGVSIPIWGTAKPSSTVIIEFAGQKKSATADEQGNWSTTLDALDASSKPATLTATCCEQVTRIEDILVGDVWLASGQSNMERHLGLHPGQQPINGWKEAARSANLPLFREYRMPKTAVDHPLTDNHARWTVCSPETATSFGAVSFFFGRDLLEATGVPIGIIHSAWGGTIVEAWTTPGTLATMPDILEASRASAKTMGGQNAPSRLYHGMISMLTRFPIKGVIWYQGESNNDRPEQYQRAFTALIRDWRALWHQPELPFLFVQIAPHKDMKPELREAQRLTSLDVPHTAMIVTTDIGDAKDIHPTRKAPVGQRLALAARALAYGENVEHSGPVYESMGTKDSTAVLTFSHTGDGLKANGETLSGFTIAGADGEFFPAKATIEGSKVHVSSDKVPAPTAVRYGWQNVPDCNLTNSHGLPASPFRTDAPATSAWIDLWDGPAPGPALPEGTIEKKHGDERYTDIATPQYQLYLPDPKKANGSAIAIFPGGGYTRLAAGHEGKEYAEWLNERGFAAMVVKYRVSSIEPTIYPHPIPFIDARRAIRTLRHNAAKWGIDPQRIGIMGSSAGGHLASLCATRFNDQVPEETHDSIDSVNCRPDFAILIYPVITLDPALSHSGSRDRMLTGSKDPQTLQLALSTDEQVSAETPRCFILSTSDDGVDCRNSLRFAAACRAHKVPVSLHLFEKGGHGYGLHGKGDLAAWPSLLDTWLKHFARTP